jgi:hypothetical protein
LFNLLLILVALGVIAWWFRGYAPGIRRMWRRARDTWRLLARVRGAVKDARGGRFDPQDFMRQSGGPAPSRGSGAARGTATKTVDADAVQVQPVGGFKVVCPTCGDALSEAQVGALRTRSVRCPGANRVGRECPYYGRSLN